MFEELHEKQSGDFLSSRPLTHGEVLIVKGHYRNKLAQLYADGGKFYTVYIHGVDGWPLIRKDYCIKLPK